MCNSMSSHMVGSGAATVDASAKFNLPESKLTSWQRCSDQLHSDTEGHHHLRLLQSSAAFLLQADLLDV